MNLKGAPPESFGAVAAWLYRTMAEPAVAPLHRRIGAEIPIERGRLLDIGCGPGRLDRLLAAARPELDVVGLDQSEAMIRQAERGPALPNLEFQLGTLTSAGFQEAFDFAVSILSFHHWEEPEAELEAAHRALRPSGRLWLYEPNPQAPDEEIRLDHAPLWGFLRLPPSWHRFLFRGHGFTSREAENVVRPAVARTPFQEMSVSARGSTLRFELRK
ncbi:MAG: trans-aconitate 2-methyltransferase [Thermoanaerobaculia bacterium]